MLFGLFTAGVIDEDAAQGLSGGGKEVSPAVPVLCLLRVHQSEICLMNERRGLERLAGRLLGQFLRCEPAQLAIHQGQKLLGGVRIALLDGGEDYGDLGHVTECRARRRGPQ